MTICDTCGDVSNSAPGLPCGRVDGGKPPCQGMYRTPENSDALYRARRRRELARDTLWLLKGALRASKLAGSRRTIARIRAAIKSAEGAVRHAECLEVREEDLGTCTGSDPEAR